MNERERWLYLDGPEPDLLRPALEALCDPEPTPEEEERMILGALAKLDVRLSSRSVGASVPVLLDDAEVESAPPTPGAPALQKEDKPPEPPPPAVHPLADLAGTARSPEFAAEYEANIQRLLTRLGLRPAPEVRVAGAQEHPRTLQLPIMDPSQGARRPPELTLQEYVAYCVELELWPDHRAGIQRKYRVESEVEHQEVVRVWELHLAAEPHLRAQADAMRASYREHGRAMERARSGGA